MRDYLYLSWFYSTKGFNKLIFEMFRFGKPSRELKLLYQKHKFEIRNLKREIVKKEIISIAYMDESYPLSLKTLEYPPWVLCVYGSIDLLGAENKLAVVGSRRPDPEVKYWLYESFVGLDKSSVILSGGAIGIDQDAHKAADLNNMKSICVLPVGIFEVYPSNLKSLIRSYIGTKNFLVMSQFHPNKKVSKSSFYPRNYVIAGLSNKVLVVQAAEKSGTMVTAKYAIDMGREVYTLPASPWDTRYSGNLKLLDEGAHQIIDLNLIHL